MPQLPGEFFIPDNEIRLPEELDYSRVDEYIRSAEAFSRSSYQSVYIIDYSGRTSSMYRQILCSCAVCRRSE